MFERYLKAKEIIEEYEARHGGFDPFVVLSGGENMEEKIYAASVEYVGQIELAYEKFSDKTTFSVRLF